MVDFLQIQTGVTKYVESEIVGKISGWQKWVIGAISAISLNKSAEIFNRVKENQLIIMLGVIDSEDKINIDLLYEEFSKQAKESGPITFDIPMVGALTLDEKDIDKLYQYIIDS